MAFNSVLKHQGSEELSESEFRSYLREKMKVVQMHEDFIERPVNVGFSGGEKKRNEILQMAVLSPRLALLDETDSGLDIDSLRIVAEGVNKLRTKNNAIVLVTHYQRLLDYIKPDFVHVLTNGRIVQTGGPELAMKLEQQGYDWLQ
jgi:Fe-S cluster assembly ATP-binding protein